MAFELFINPLFDGARWILRGTQTQLVVKWKQNDFTFKTLNKPALYDLTEVKSGAITSLKKTSKRI